MLEARFGVCFAISIGTVLDFAFFFKELRPMMCKTTCCVKKLISRGLTSKSQRLPRVSSGDSQDSETLKINLKFNLKKYIG